MIENTPDQRFVDSAFLIPSTFPDPIHYDTGTWAMDAENNTLSVSWDLGWGSSTSHVYLVNNIVKIFDSTSGKLNTSFDEQIDDVESIKTFEF